MENKNFMALTDEELYEVNGGQSGHEVAVAFVKAAWGFVYQVLSQNDSKYPDDVYKGAINNEIKAPKVEFKYKDETHEKYVELQKQVAEIKKSSNK